MIKSFTDNLLSHKRPPHRYMKTYLETATQPDQDPGEKAGSKTRAEYDMLWDICKRKV